MQKKLVAAKGWLWGIGMLLVSLTAPKFSPMVAGPLLWIGLLLVAVPTLNMIWVFGKLIVGPQRSTPLRVLRDLPMRVVGAAQGFLEPPRPRGADAVKEGLATNSLREVVALARPAVDALRGLFRDVYNASVAARTTAFSHLVQRQQDALGRALAKLQADIDDSVRLDSLRVSLVDFNDIYMATVRALHDYGRLGIELTEAPFGGVYAEWESAHRAYCDRVKQVREHPGLTELRSAIPNNLLTDGEGWRWHSIYWGANRTLSNLTPAQSMFLRLFT